LFNAITNSDLISYILNIKLINRHKDSWAKLNKTNLLDIPIPKDLDEDLVSQISEISKGLTEGIYGYSEKEKELNELIFRLYELSYWEKQRIRDYFLPERKINGNNSVIDKYKSTLADSINFFLKNPIDNEDIEFADSGFNLLVAKISLNGGSNSLSVKKMQRFVMNEIFIQNPNENFLALQEKIFGEDCVYIIKENINKNWTETKAFEDGQDIIKHLIPRENGERIH
jgi:hypothetical protein